MRTVLAALVVLSLTACATDEERYCEAVEDRQEELTEIMGSGEQDALIQALPTFEALREDALPDIRDEWDTVIQTIDALREALEDAGVDPSSYDPTDLPDGVTEEERDRIAAAATDLGSPQMTAAFEGVEQQARDVCGTPLFL